MQKYNLIWFKTGLKILKNLTDQLTLLSDNGHANKHTSPV